MVLIPKAIEDIISTHRGTDDKKEGFLSYCLHQLNEPRFHALACLLATKRQHQESNTSQFNNSVPSQDGVDGSDTDEASDDGDEDETVTPRRLVKSKGTKILKEKFLDRLAEVLSCRKAWFRKQITHTKGIGKANRSKRSKPVVSLKDGENVAAAGMVETQQKVMIYVAKNAGLDSNDQKIIRQLQVWIRALATTGRRRYTDTDSFWGLLLTYYSERLDMYEKKFLEAFRAHHHAFCKNKRRAVNQKVLNLAQLCYEVGPGDSHHYIVSLAYELRYEPDLLPILDIETGGTPWPVFRSIAFLGRLRRA
ncbi:MAG: hypothetical protein M1812_001942 [Candelaria pacifica]|nr:MAG: hypothetical protein M1812_001942 [Candelaria pacifica]